MAGLRWVGQGLEPWQAQFIPFTDKSRPVGLSDGSDYVPGYTLMQ